LPARRPALIAFALWLLLAAGAVIGLAHLRRDAVDSQSRELNLMSRALSDDIGRGLRGAEEGLQAVREELRESRLPLVGAAATQALRTRAELMPLVATLWLVDGAGRLVAASDAAPPPALSSFVPALRQLPEGAMALGQPYADPDRPGALVALAMPCGDGGVILAAIPASALLGAFSAALPSPDARMAVLRSDGVRLVASPSAPAPAFGDGGDEIVAAQGVARYGVQVVVSRHLAAALLSWRQTAEVTGAALLLLLLGMGAVARRLQTAEQRRRDAQQALQAQLARASRLESLGTLAGGVAHDFNNLLAGIVGYGEMAQDAAVRGSDQARHLDKLLQAAARGKALVERILAFSRGGARASTVFELTPVVEEVLGLLAGSLPPGIVLERALDAPGARLRGDPTPAFEAVMNLCSNALQAMPEGGMLSVRLAREAVAAPRVLSHSALRPGHYLALSVGDQGGGITPAVMDHLFEPFFTTRSAQSGTGLGLAVVHGVVAEFGGAIDVRSRPGQGACFTLYLPECTDAAALPAAPAALPAPGAGQRLMVVDDEADLVGLAMEMLAGLGYAPEGYTDAEVALQALRARPRHYAALLTDEVMPGLGGTQLAQAVRAFAPRLPVLLVSGYGGALLAQRAAAAGVTRVLAKPLPRAELARALAELLP
jgi:signal transduction histidine kinase